MERISLTAEKREVGKSISKKLRAAGKIPAVLYGRGAETLAICVDMQEMEKITKTKAGMNVLIDLAIKGGGTGIARIRDYQADPFKRLFTHVDFQTISLTEKLEVEVPVVLVGEAKGVKDGGVLEQPRRKIVLQALPGAIPDKIELDIAELKIGDSIHADEIKLPDGVDFPHETNFSIVAVVPPAKEEAPPAEAEIVVAEGEEAPKAERGAAEAAAEGAAKDVRGAKEGKKEEKEKA